MFRKHQGRRRTNILFVIFRLVLSLAIFATLLGGMYAAYKQFSGLDPLKLDPQAVFKNILAARTPQQVIAVLSSIKIDPKILGQKASGEKQQPVPVVQATNFRFLLLADSHNDNVNLQKALNQAKNSYPDIQFIIGLGDITNTGTVVELQNTKKELDSFGLRYFLVPGDHDLWDSRDKSLPSASRFREVFGPDYQAFTFGGYRFVLLDNADNYVGFDSAQLNWITTEFEKAKSDAVRGILVFMHEPLYHPSSDHTMGWVEKSLKLQASVFLFQMKDAGVSKVFAGDIHYFSKYQEPKTNLSMITVGAIGIERNPQAPRFAVVSVLDNGEIKVDDVEIK